MKRLDQQRAQNRVLCPDLEHDRPETEQKARRCNAGACCYKLDLAVHTCSDSFGCAASVAGSEVVAIGCHIRSFNIICRHQGKELFELSLQCQPATQSVLT